jgi:hypothetical protein
MSISANTILPHHQIDFIDYFCKIQKIYNVLNRFVYNFKYKRAKIVVNTDMYLNQLDINNENVFCLFHNNSKYLFVVNDLIKIIDTALTNSHMFFAEPLCIKNPYSNLPFNKSMLYNIYMFIRYKTHMYSELFFRFFYCNFNISLFKNKNEYLLREYTIKNYVYNSPHNILVDEIKEMILIFNNYCNVSGINNFIKIDEDFPNVLLIKIMRPYLLLHCESEYSFITSIKNDSRYLLRKKLIKFNNYNRQFGRKRYKIEFAYTSDLKKKIKKKIIEFNSNHINFNNIKNENDNFLTDHLNYQRQYINNNTTFNFNFMNQGLRHISNEYSQDESSDIYEDGEYYEEDEDEDEDEDKEEEEDDDDEDDEDEDASVS